MVAVVVRWTSATGFFGLGWWPLWLRRADAAVQTSGVWCVMLSWCAIGWVGQLPMGMHRMLLEGQMRVRGSRVFRGRYPRQPDFVSKPSRTQMSTGCQGF